MKHRPRGHFSREFALLIRRVFVNVHPRGHALAYALERSPPRHGRRMAVCRNANDLSDDLRTGGDRKFRLQFGRIRLEVQRQCTNTMFAMEFKLNSKRTRAQQRGQLSDRGNKGKRGMKEMPFFFFFSSFSLPTVPFFFPKKYLRHLVKVDQSAFFLCHVVDGARKGHQNEGRRQSIGLQQRRNVRVQLSGRGR